MIQTKKHMLGYRRFKDIFRDSMAYILSACGVLFLGLILTFVFIKGTPVLSWSFITSDYNVKVMTVSYESEQHGEFEDPNIENVYFSTNWGVGLEDSTDAQGQKIVIVSYIDHDSPLKEGMVNIADQTSITLELGDVIGTMNMTTSTDSLVFGFTKDGAEKIAKNMDKAIIINSMSISTPGGGIRGSIISTLLMILFTLLFALPLGIGAAIYFTLIAKQNRLTRALRTLIDLAGGIPTIIYGLVGAVIFIPFINFFSQKQGGSILSGALTLAIMLLPVIIRTTEEALKTVPSHYRSASLALGASETQTIFKVMVPNALPGILTAILLSIGRIIGESAALIYAMGTAIKDQIFLTEGSSTLALHIWTLMAGENPDYQAACGVAIIILIVDLLLMLAVKLISMRFMKKFKR